MKGTFTIHVDHFQFRILFYQVQGLLPGQPKEQGGVVVRPEGGMGNHRYGAAEAGRPAGARVQNVVIADPVHFVVALVVPAGGNGCAGGHQQGTQHLLGVPGILDADFPRLSVGLIADNLDVAPSVYQGRLDAWLLGQLVGGLLNGVAFGYRSQIQLGTFAKVMVPFSWDTVYLSGPHLARA